MRKNVFHIYHLKGTMNNISIFINSFHILAASTMDFWACTKLLFSTIQEQCNVLFT